MQAQRHVQAFLSCRSAHQTDAGYRYGLFIVRGHNMMYSEAKVAKQTFRRVSGGLIPELVPDVLLEIESIDDA